MELGPPVTLQVLFMLTTPATCPPLGLGLPSPPPLFDGYLGTAHADNPAVSTPLSHEEMDRDPKPKVHPLVSLNRRRQFSIAADAPQLSAAPLGPHLSQSHIVLYIVLPTPEEATETLIHTRCPKTHRPHLLPVKMPPTIVGDPIHHVHRRSLPHETRPPSLKNIVMPLETVVVFAIFPPTVVPLVLLTRVPRQLH